MSTIVTRAGKGSPLTHAEVDANFTNLNADKLESGDNVSALANDAGYTTNVGDITGVTAGSGITGGGTSGTVTINHADTSSQASVNNSGRTYIQDITLDTYGHITGITSATETVVDTNTTYSAGAGLSLAGTTFSTVSAPKWTTSRTLSLTGDASGSTSWDGSGNASLSVTVADDSHNHIISNVDGLQTALDGKLSTTGKAADSNLLDGLDSTAFYLASNPNGYTTNVGDITGVTAGTGLTGGGTSGTVTVSHADTSSQGSVNNSGLTFIQDVSLDAYGHVTSLSSATIAATTGAEKAYFVVYSDGGVIYSSVGFSSVTISSNDATHNFTTAMASSTSYSIAANNNSTGSGIAEIFSETATSFRIAWENRGSGTALGSINRVTVLS